MGADIDDLVKRLLDEPATYAVCRDAAAALVTQAKTLEQRRCRVQELVDRVGRQNDEIDKLKGAKAR
jgi:hypothetical protein